MSFSVIHAKTVPRASGDFYRSYLRKWSLATRYWNAFRINVRLRRYDKITVWIMRMVSGPKWNVSFNTVLNMFDFFHCTRVSTIIVGVHTYIVTSYCVTKSKNIFILWLPRTNSQFARNLNKSSHSCCNQK